VISGWCRLTRETCDVGFNSRPGAIWWKGKLDSIAHRHLLGEGCLSEALSAHGR